MKAAVDAFIRFGVVVDETARTFQRLGILIRDVERDVRRARRRARYNERMSQRARSKR